MNDIAGNPSEAGYIQFQCNNCQHQLKVPDVAAGKRAQCPSCQTVQEVPEVDRPPIGMSNEQPPEAFGHAPDQDSPIPGSPPANALPGNAPLNTIGTIQPSPAPITATANTISTTPVVASPAQNQTAQNPAEPAMASPLQPAANALHPGATLTPNAPSNVPQRPVGHHVDRTGEGEQTETRQLYDRIRTEVSKIFVGQDELILGTLVALFSSGHVLIESVPGLGKTLFVRVLGKALGCDFGRIQFTADLMPSDVTGAPIFSMKTSEFEFRKGPVFTQLLLADEINRSPAKTHAALLEIMQEYRVTVDGTTHTLEKPFLVMATQNPIESEGTYNLPEAQLDRFMFKLYVDYPDEGEEARILELHSQQVNLQEQLDNEIATITSPEEIVRITKANANIQIAPQLLDYINKLVRMTRQWPQFHMGASPRAGIALMQGARTLAAFSGRDYAIPDDVVEIALPTLRHRVILTAEAEVEGQQVDQILQEMIRAVEVPRI